MCCNHPIAGPADIHLAVTKKQKINDFLFLEFCSVNILTEQILVEFRCLNLLFSRSTLHPPSPSLLKIYGVVDP